VQRSDAKATHVDLRKVQSEVAIELGYTLKASFIAAFEIVDLCGRDGRDEGSRGQARSGHDC
jgi:hypothetical protein